MNEPQATQTAQTSLTSLHVIVTGASSGLGRALARELSPAGHRVLCLPTDVARPAGYELDRLWPGVGDVLMRALVQVRRQ